MSSLFLVNFCFLFKSDLRLSLELERLRVRVEFKVRIKFRVREVKSYESKGLGRLRVKEVEG